MTALSFVAQAARGLGLPQVPQKEIDKARTIVERFMIRWRGEPDPDHVRAVDAYFVSAAEHGLNASTFTARIVASTGADVAACVSSAIGALSGPLHGGAPSRVLKMLDDVEAEGDARRYVKHLLDTGQRLMGFGHRVYRAEDPRAPVLRRTAKELGSRRVEVADALEAAALAELRERKPDRVIATNVEFWSAVVLDFAQVPPHMFTSMFTCARTAGWSAHILEQKRTGRLIRPAAHYIGAPPRGVGIRWPGAPCHAGPPHVRSRCRRPHVGSNDVPDIRFPDDLLPTDGRFGSGPTKVRPEAVAALRCHRPRFVGHVPPAGPGPLAGAAVRDGLASLFGLPQGYEVVLGNGGATAFWDAAAFGLVRRRASISCSASSPPSSRRSRAAPPSSTSRRSRRARRGATPTGRPRQTSTPIARRTTKPPPGSRSR